MRSLFTVTLVFTLGLGNAQEEDSTTTELTTTEYYELLMDSVANGQVAPDFAYPNMNGDTVKLSDFRGNYVVIDIWATWCSPCIAELPALEKLKKKFEDDSVVFVSVSVDKIKEDWSTFVTENDLTDYQLYSGDPFSAPIWYYTIIDGRDYGKERFGTAIPQFIIIDPEGVIVDNLAPRPNNKQLKWDLQDYLEDME